MTLPERTVPEGATAYRIYRAWGPDGENRAAWFFSSTADPLPGRFDLPPPRGTCYLSDGIDGAWLEVFRGARAVHPDDIAQRRVLIATTVRDHGPWADLTHRDAVLSGVTLDVAGGDDYRVTQAIAAIALRQGARGVIGWLRHHSSATLRTLAIFGRRGAAPRAPTGWHTNDQPLEMALGLISPALRRTGRTAPRAMTPVAATSIAP